MSSFESHKIDRRTFLFTGFAAAMGATMGVTSQKALLETLTQWFDASRRTRELALQPCLDRIRDMDPSIHAWVQVLPQRPTGKGKLSAIPFGVKDIIETRGLATEYGSPIYKGRIGAADAAIVRDLRQREGILLGKTQCTAFAYFTPPPFRMHSPCYEALARPFGQSPGWARNLWTWFKRASRSLRSGTMKPCGTSIHASLDLQSCSRPRP